LGQCMDMDKAKSPQNLKSHTATLASVVANNAKHVEVLILGAGRGGKAMLEVLQRYDWVHIKTIVDIVENAIAFSMARQLGVPTSIDRGKALEQFNGDIIIDVSGDLEMGRKLSPVLQLRQIDFITGQSAKLLFDLVHEQLRNKKSIQIQNTRLNLLDSMLDITMQLEDRPPLIDISTRSLSDLHAYIQAVKGLAVVFNGDGSCEVAGAIHTAKPTSDLFIYGALQPVLQGLTRHHRFKVLSQPVMHDDSGIQAAYNIVLPLWQHDNIAGVLLFELPGELSREQETTLKMASIHLNMAAKTLDHYQKLESMAIHDGLTETYNRRYFDQKLKSEISRLQRSNHGTLTCIFIDIDDFKHVNDTYSHGVGDLVLKAVVNCISRSIRDYDICARYGGDEFVVLLPNDLPGEGAGIEKIGLRMLEYISAIKITDAPELKVSVSLGMATLSSETLDGEKLLNMADQAVYKAKEAGKHCLRIHTEEKFHIADNNK